MNPFPSLVPRTLKSEQRRRNLKLTIVCGHNDGDGLKYEQSKCMCVCVCVCGTDDEEVG